jgi:hypothetical protein
MVSQFWCCIALWCVSTHNISCDWHTYYLLSWTTMYSDQAYDRFRANYAIYQVKLVI